MVGARVTRYLNTKYDLSDCLNFSRPNRLAEIKSLQLNITTECSSAPDLSLLIH